MATQAALNAVRKSLAIIKDVRDSIKYAESVVKEEQVSVLGRMAEDEDILTNGVKFVSKGGESLAGYVQQNNPSEYWDQAGLIEWLRENGEWNNCSTRMFDQAKFESAVQQGVIPAKKINKFRLMGTPPAPFIRFGKPKEESL